jgi:hypothetical protein
MEIQVYQNHLQFLTLIDQLKTPIREFILQDINLDLIFKEINGYFKVDNLFTNNVTKSFEKRSIWMITNDSNTIINLKQIIKLIESILISVKDNEKLKFQ